MFWRLVFQQQTGRHPSGGSGRHPSGGPGGQHPPVTAQPPPQQQQPQSGAAPTAQPGAAKQAKPNNGKVCTAPMLSFQMQSNNIEAIEMWMRDSPVRSLHESASSNTAYSERLVSCPSPRDSLSILWFPLAGNDDELVAGRLRQETAAKGEERDDPS